MRYFFRVEYDGGAFHGWQYQPNCLSVQESLERAIAIVARQKCSVAGAGRTDAGVHARRQGAHVDLEGVFDLRVLERSINSVLPREVAIYDIRQVDGSFHARYSARLRTYRYYVALRKSPLVERCAWAITWPVDWELVGTQLALIRGRHDFSSFCAAGSAVEMPVCDVTEARLESVAGQWVFLLSANRFVYRMVRSIVGTVVEIGRGGLNGPLNEILESRDRSRAGRTAPAHGLVLEDVFYDGVDE